MMNQATGLLDEKADGQPEQEVMDALVAAVEGFGQLPLQHPDELPEFAQAIHRCQDILAMRIVRRAFPRG